MVRERFFSLGVAKPLDDVIIAPTPAKAIGVELFGPSQPASEKHDNKANTTPARAAPGCWGAALAQTHSAVLSLMVQGFARLRLALAKQAFSTLLKQRRMVYCVCSADTNN
jgi:hypothetical protein